MDSSESSAESRAAAGGPARGAGWTEVVATPAVAALRRRRQRVAGIGWAVVLIYCGLAGAVSWWPGAGADLPAGAAVALAAAVGGPVLAVAAVQVWRWGPDLDRCWAAAQAALQERTDVGAEETEACEK